MNNNLLTIVSAASSAIARAQSAAEILELKENLDAVYEDVRREARLAKLRGAKDEYIEELKVVKARCIEGITYAEIRMVEEVDRAREDGQLAQASGGRPKTVPRGNGFDTVGFDAPTSTPQRPKDFGEKRAEELARVAQTKAADKKKVARKKAAVAALPPAATLAEAGLTRKDIHNARVAADAEKIKPGIVTETIQNILASGDEPTKKALRRQLRAEIAPLRAADAAEKKTRRAAKEKALGTKMKAENERLGKKLYGVILMDPPWKHKPWSEETGMDRAADNHYPTMTFDEIRDAAPPAAKNSIVFLWAKRNNIGDALALFALWGFEYRTCLVWLKEGNPGNGYWLRDNAELLLIAVKGKSIPAPAPGEQPLAALSFPKGKHSEKPEEFRDIIHGMFPNLPKLEMYSRSEHPGFDSWGAEAGGANQ